uniref:Uncharacterized protein n=1 Tax=Nelumbo nucifera TaxID=4432 RepID=A0A822YF42_NELNU|nr:TPA_asm: hypothetical protein HUJ06_011645 [Nelumbo nucifera]
MKNMNLRVHNFKFIFNSNQLKLSLELVLQRSGSLVDWISYKSQPSGTCFP